MGRRTLVTQRMTEVTPPAAAACRSPLRPLGARRGVAGHEGAAAAGRAQLEQRGCRAFYVAEASGLQEYFFFLACGETDEPRVGHRRN